MINFYIDQTSRNLSSRVTEHQKHWILYKSVIANHCINLNHTFNFNKPKSLANELKII